MAKLEMFGLPGLRARIDAIGRDTPRVVEIALNEEAHTIINDAVTNYVPRDTGHLADTWEVEPPVVTNRDVSVELGFGAEYALDVHENPRSGKTEGWNPDGTRRYQHWARTGEWKYLETPLKAHAPEVATELRKSINAYIDGLGDGDTVNIRPLPRRQPRPTGNDILEGP